MQDREAFYGGQVGGGKSDALLMGALMYADVPGYSAMIFRRTFSDLSQPDALIPRSHEWLGPTPAKWSEQKHSWTFPSGATLSFGYMAHENDKYNYQGSAAQYYGWDELTQFEESQYLYLLSRLRRRANSPVPLRVRSASNPGNIGHEWVYERFVVGPHPFVPASLDDNPHLATEEYRKNLEELDDVTRAQLLEGQWITDPARKPFRREWWRGQNRYEPEPQSDNNNNNNNIAMRWISWDTALKDKVENAYNACVVGELDYDYRLHIREVYRERLQFPDLTDAIRGFAERYDTDGRLRSVVIEDKASGASAFQTLAASTSPRVAAKLKTYAPRGSKEERWSQAAVWCKRGCVLLPHPSPAVPWLYDFEHELFNVPDTRFADQADAFAQLVSYVEPLLAEGWHRRKNLTEGAA